MFSVKQIQIEYTLILGVMPVLSRMHEGWFSKLTTGA
jgi:hypothetical protein